MNMNPAQHLHQQLQLHQPSSILFASQSSPDHRHLQQLSASNEIYQALSTYSAANDSEIHSIDLQASDFEHLPRCDFAVVVDFLEHLPKATGIQRLGQLRNFLSQRIWVLITQCPMWGFNDFIGLGFSSIAPNNHTPDDTNAADSEDWRQLQCYGYDLSTYNRIRSWNNPRHWANPENFGKYRW